MILIRVAGDGLVGALETFAAPWAKIYAHSKPVSAAVLYLHLVTLIISGGVAFGADRATLRAAGSGAAERARQLKELWGIHRLVLVGLAISFISGVLLFLSDVATFLGSVYIWIKLGCVALLLVNGFFMTQTEKALDTSPDDDALWGRLRVIAITSAFLWLATALAGVVLSQFA